MRCRRTLSPDPDPDTKPNPSLKPNPEPDPNPDPNHNPDPKGMLPLHRVCREDASSTPPLPQQQPEQPTLALCPRRTVPPPYQKKCSLRRSAEG